MYVQQRSILPRSSALPTDVYQCANLYDYCLIVVICTRPRYRLGCAWAWVNTCYAQRGCLYLFCAPMNVRDIISVSFQSIRLNERQVQ